MKIYFKGYFIQKGHFCQHWITLKFLQTHVSFQGNTKEETLKMSMQRQRMCTDAFKLQRKHNTLKYHTLLKVIDTTHVLYSKSSEADL